MRFWTVCCLLNLAVLSAASEPNTPAAIASEEYEVYAAIFMPNEPEIPEAIKDPLKREIYLAEHYARLDIPVLGGKGPFYLLEMTRPRQLPAAKPADTEGGKSKTDISLRDDFNAKNSKPARLEQRFPSPAKIVLIRESETREIFGAGGGGWKEYRKRYPMAGGTLAFSRVGIDKDKTHAVVFIHSQADYEMGAGYYVYLEKAPKSGKWVIVGSILAFMS